jgi:O-antigen ligase/polysaccharide polymerase Wzy-like membrane protein
VAVTYDAVQETAPASRDRGARRQVSPGIKRLALVYLWITIATGGIVYWEPAPYDGLMIGAIILLPLVGFAPFTRGLSVYLLLLCGIVAGGYIATTQAGLLSVPVTHVSITLYLALSSVVMAAFVAHNPDANVRLIMSAYMAAALVAASAALIGYFDLVPGLYDIFTEFGRARGTFKDPNVLGAFLVPALLYAFNVVLTARLLRGSLWAIALPLLLLGTLLSVSRGAWLNLAVSLVVYSAFVFIIAATNRERLKLIIVMVLAGLCAVGVLAAAQSIPKVADIMGERATFEQSYDVGPEGRFGGQEKAAELVVTHPLGIGALEFGRVHHHEDVHEVYLNMYLNTGWFGGTLYIFLVLATLVLGVQLVLRDRGGNGLSAVLVAAFIGMVLEGAVIDTDHWRHFYLIMAMIWGMALARPYLRRDGS